MADLGGREAFIKNARQTCVVLGDEERRIIKEQKGDAGASGFIRDLILNSVILGNGENAGIQQELKEAKAKIATFEKKEKAVSKEKEEAMAYIAKGLELYKNEDERRASNPETCRRWIDARCKGSGISASDFLNYQLGLEYQAHFLSSFTE